jgi:dimethylamine/trimethylamine dehydrogenase
MATTDDATYFKTLLDYYEDEVMGEAYFRGLAEHSNGPTEHAKYILLAAVERHAAAATRPIVDRHGLTPRSEAELFEIGESHVARHQNHSWMAFVDYMLVRFPGYVDDFENLERMAPEADLPALKFLTLHEVVTIDFAKLEKAGDPDSLAPLHRYLAHDAFTSGSS